MINKSEFDCFVADAVELIKKRRKEHVLRDHISASLPRIFSDKPWWVKEHTFGSEFPVSWFEDGEIRRGSIDVRIGKTAIEYENDLRKASLLDEGFHQVKQYCAGLLNKGVQKEELYGVLSDTIRWYAYSVIHVSEVSGRPIGPDDIELSQLETVDLSLNSPTVADEFSLFAANYFGRDGNKPLTADNISIDFGVGSAFYRDHIQNVLSFIEKKGQERPDYFALIIKLWQKSTTAYSSASNDFSLLSFANEFYMVTLAKFICQAALEGKASSCTDGKLLSVANGDYFKAQNIVNLVDYDYFGWISEKDSSLEIIGFLRELNHALIPFDFRLVEKGDLFGMLISELSTAEKRILLGQEFTPSWLAREICRHVSGAGNKSPKILDMCCGSGVFLVESLKHLESIGIEGNSLFSSVTGFDIDPLAVMLAKANWIFAMRHYFSTHVGEIFVPIYQCDSLSTALPLSKECADGSKTVISIGGKDVTIPNHLLKPDASSLFDYLLNALHTLAESNISSEECRLQSVSEIVASGLNAFGQEHLSGEESLPIYQFALELESVYEERYKSNLNGIWPFVIGNCYRPGLLRESFDVIVSNPPWLAMSKLPSNPYKPKIEQKVELLGLKPSGSSFLHMELATLFAIYSVQNYLKPDGEWAFILPDSVLNGNHHDHFRRLICESSLDVSLREVWVTPHGTFSNKAVVFFGKRSSSNKSNYPGLIYEEEQEPNEALFQYSNVGARSVITIQNQLSVLSDSPVISINQGADIFPRTALFHEMSKNANGSWRISPFVNGGSGWFLIEDKKKDIALDIEGDGFDDTYVFFCLTSKLLYPFMVSDPVPMILPVSRLNGRYEALSEAEIATTNNSTRIILERIINESYPHNNDPRVEFFVKTNYRNKLQNQRFEPNTWYLLSSAGGSNPCASAFKGPSNGSKVICDQTLYWFRCKSEEEAIYYSGLINSAALRERIAVYQPRGEFGERHIHTLPFRIIEEYCSDNPHHKKVVYATKQIAKELNEALINLGHLDWVDPNSSGSLASKRKRTQNLLQSLESYALYESACSAVLK